MNLNPRLNAIYDFLEKDMSLADVGCDHGYLCIEYAKHNKAKVIAIDNKEGPLNVCKENAKNENLLDKITFSLSSGISQISDDINQVVIAGMGGNNIVDILSNDLSKLNNLKNLVLQPNSSSKLVREFLNEHGYVIADEVLIKDNEVIYEIIKAITGEEKLNYKDLYFGPIIRKNKGSLFNEKYLEYKNYLESVIKKIPVKEDNIEKINKIKDEISLIEEEL